jgi:hypothetical protein
MLLWLFSQLQAQEGSDNWCVPPGATAKAMTNISRGEAGRRGPPKPRQHTQGFLTLDALLSSSSCYLGATGLMSTHPRPHPAARIGK